MKSQTLVEREEEEGDHGVGDHLGREIDQLLMSRGHFELIASAHNCSPVSQPIPFSCLIMVQGKLRGHKRNNREDKKHWLARKRVSVHTTNHQRGRRQDALLAWETTLLPCQIHVRRQKLRIFTIAMWFDMFSGMQKLMKATEVSR